MRYARCAALAAALLILTGCARGAESSLEESSAFPAPVTSASEDSASVTVTTTAASPRYEGTQAENGQAFLYISDEDFRAVYNGTADSPLSAGATAVTITRDGSYTVSVDAGASGCAWELSSDPDSEYVCEGLGFASVVLAGGGEIAPNASIDVDEVRVDGRNLELAARNYTAEDGAGNLRGVLWNAAVTEFPADAHTSLGAVSGAFGEVSPMVVNPADFESWQKVEVSFTVSGFTEAQTTEQTTALP